MDSADASAPLVAVVVVNWHKRGATLDCIAALTRLTYPRWYLVLVDNGCIDFSPAELARLVPDGTYLHSPTNLGFAGGANRGLREALKRDAAWVWFLNNDTLPEAGALDALIDVARRPPGAAIVGAKILQRLAPDRLDSVGLEVDLGSGRIWLIGHDQPERGQCDRLTDPVAVTACAMLVSRRAAEQLGGFDETFFTYLEDADLCLRARALGLRVAFAPRARVLHDRPPAHRRRQSAESLYYATRNHLALLQRYSPAPPWRRKLQEVEVIFRYLAFAVRGSERRLAALRAVRQGVREYRRGR